jgi:hypothetical protein
MKRALLFLALIAAAITPNTSLSMNDGQSDALTNVKSDVKKQVVKKAVRRKKKKKATVPQVADTAPNTRPAGILADKPLAETKETKAQLIARTAALSKRYLNVAKEYDDALAALLRKQDDEERQRAIFERVTREFRELRNLVGILEQEREEATAEYDKANNELLAYNDSE